MDFTLLVVEKDHLTDPARARAARLALAPAAVLVVLLLLPTASANACYEWVAVELAPDEAAVTLSMAYVGESAGPFRAAIDKEYGNGDGTASEEEVRRFTSDWTHEVDDDKRCGAKLEVVTLDGERATSLTSIRTRTDDARGRASSPDPLLAEMRLGFAFAPAASSEARAEVRFFAAQSVRAALACAFPSAMEGWSWPNHFCGAQRGDYADPERMFKLLPLGDAALRGETLMPTSLKPSWKSEKGGLYAEEPAQLAILERQVATVNVTAQTEPLVPPWAFAAGGAVAGLALAIVTVRSFRVRWLHALGVGVAAFTRITDREAVEHPRRQEILAVLAEQPGVTLVDLRRATGMAPGALGYHLRVLQRHRRVLVRREGTRTRVFLVGADVEAAPYVTPVQERLLVEVARAPGLTQQDLASRMGVSRFAVAYHARLLSRHGVLRAQREGRELRYFR